MILDSLQNAEKYESLHPAFTEAFEYIKNTDITKIEQGIIELKVKDLFVNYAEITGKTREEAKLEIHNEYIDIQIPFSADETMGYRPACALVSPVAPYNAEKDITFFNDKASAFIDVRMGQFVIFFPDDGHLPGIVDGTYT